MNIDKKDINTYLSLERKFKSIKNYKASNYLGFNGSSEHEIEMFNVLIKNIKEFSSFKMKTIYIRTNAYEFISETGDKIIIRKK